MSQRISSPVFVGRASELEAFERLVRRAEQGAGCALLVSGEAGIGKSRFLSEAEYRLRQTHALLLTGECVEVAEGELAFAPIVAALRPVMDDAAAVGDLESPLRVALGALWPTLGNSGPASREQLFEAIYRVLAGLAQRRLVVLMIEDLHWIDRSSRDLLGFLVRNARRDRLLFVATYRPDELHRGHPLSPFLAELERSGQAQRLELAPLGRAELADQLEAIAGTRLAGQTIDQIFARSEGNPFYAEELLATGDTGPPDDLPGSLRAALLLRVEALAPDTQEVLRAAAVVGRSVDHRLLGLVSGMAETDLNRVLREAVEHHVLVLTGRGMAYTFRHALLREAIYDDTLVGERLRLHRVIAEALAAQPELATAGAAAELAYHWHAAGEHRAALRASLEAASEAAAMHAYDEAARHVRRALELWDRVAVPEEALGVDRIDLLLQASELAEYAGEAETALALAEQARAGLDETVEPLRTARAERLIARAMMYSARAADGLEHLAAARRLVPRDPPSLDYLEGLSSEGRVMMLNGQMIEARVLLEEAIPLAEQLSALALHAGTLSALAIVYSNLGQLEEAVVAGRECIRLANQSGSAEQIARAYINGSQALDDSGLIGDALAIGLDGIAAVDRLGLSRGPGDQLRMQAGWRLLRLGRLQDADRVMQPGLDGATAQFNVAGLLSISGRVAAERGEFDAAEQRLNRSWELMQRSGGFQLIGPNIAWRALLHIYRGELAQAQKCLGEGLRRVARSEGDLIYNAELFWLAARLAADLAEATPPGDVTAAERAAQAAAAAIAEFDRVISLARGNRAPPEGLAFRALAEAELTRVRGEDDPEPWRTAGELFSSLDEGLRVAYTRFRAAQALSRGGADTKQFEAALREAYETAISRGARALQAELERFAMQVGVTLRTPTVAGEPTARPGEPRVDEVLDILTANRRGPPPERLLATIVFTDIIGSTALAAELGDSRWREVLDGHDELVRAEVKRFGGAVVKFIGDGTLSAFDGPGRAIECACALREAVKSLGIELRAGVHTGEIEVRRSDIGGIAVHIGARIAARAGRSEVLVSQTVADVVAGSGIQFESRGAHELKGVPGTWQLSAVLRTSEH